MEENDRLLRENQQLKELVMKLEETVRRQDQDLQRLRRVREEFVEMAAHELRTPITVIQESLAQLRDRIFGEMTSEQANLVSLALNNVARLTGWINQFIHSAKKN